MAKIELAVIIISYNTKQLLTDCLESILRQPIKSKYQLWVVDNDSKDGSVQMLKKDYPQVKLIENQTNTGFTKANNQVIFKEDADYYLLLNSDTILLDNAFDILLKVAKEKNYGVLSPKILNLDKTLQPNGGDLPTFGPLINWLFGLDDLAGLFKKKITTFHKIDGTFYHGTKSVGWVGGTVFLIKKELIEKNGGLDEQIFMYAEDVDYCWRAKKAGFKVGWTDQTAVIHLGGGSSKSPRYAQWRGEFHSLIYLYQKFYGKISAALVKLLIYKAILLRMVGFSLLGKFNYVKVYAQVIKSI